MLARIYFWKTLHDHREREELKQRGVLRILTTDDDDNDNDLSAYIIHKIGSSIGSDLEHVL